MQSVHSRFKRWMPAVLGVTMSLFSVGAVHAFAGGVTGVSGQSGSTCGSCHDGAAAPAVTLSGPTTLGTGATGSYSLTMQRSGGNAFGGLDVSASGGTLTSTTTGTRMANGEITHSMSNSVPTTGRTWTFNWQAPTAPGTYTLYAAVASTNGSGDGGDGTAARTLAVTVTAMNQAPVARISGPMTAVEGMPVTFSGSASSDADGSIVTYEWNFGDGTPAAGPSVTHTYVAGTYTVTLTVTDNAGATGSATQTITVTPAGQPQPPVADPDGPYSGTVGSPVQFDGSGSSDPDGSIASYLWNFGDGTTASTVSPTHVYTAPGTYMVQLTVTDNSGQTGTAQTAATITAAPPTGDGEALYDSFCASCHGPGGRGGPDGSVVGEDAEDIIEAIMEVPTMRPLAGVLDATQIEAIAAYLAMGQGGDDDDDEDKPKKDKKKCKKGEHGKGKNKCRPNRDRD